MTANPLGEEWFDAMARDEAHARYLKGRHDTAREFISKGSQ